MFARSQQVSSPLLLPMVGSILAASVGASIFFLPPTRATLSLQQLFLGQHSISQSSAAFTSSRFGVYGD
jgi:hypothetical protein